MTEFEKWLKYHYSWIFDIWEKDKSDELIEWVKDKFCLEVYLYE